ncbi:C40 family peptidase [Clostridium sp.]|uniref:C40 family peptidase n=1 Tax=Clostridium sp. TaxID=1506 RepID=UPI0028FFA7FA|nr:C40 family peptidase [Clostridium sp.]MDU2108697.1 C40 family peptidase [Clostridium sp.]MDU3355192.1 C40 family peptidase [Clostridium sp.]MDU4727950.1 C40 family peptidase [Clostridium sp.]
MSKEKKLIKKTMKIIVSLNVVTIITLLLMTATIAVITNQNYSMNSGNGSSITDIGALGVPQEYVPYFNEVSSVFNIPNWCLAAVAKQESNFNPNTSYEGAYGIMQIQKIDTSTGKDLWKYLIDNGLGKIYLDNGYSFNDSEEMWGIFLTDPKAQIYAGAYEIRYYTNYVLYKQGKVSSLNYNSNENMDLIEWNSDENDSDFRETLRRIFACYNGGPFYGMSVDLDNAQHDYPNKVFKYAIEFRDVGLTASSNSIIEKSIEAGMKWVDKSPYVWGGGRTQEDVDAGRFDCSSFVHYCYATTGVQLGNRASVTTDTLVLLGEEVSFNDIQRGDLIFFDTYKTNGHVGIWLGDNKFLHDGTSNGVTVSEFKGYYVERFNGVIRRVVKTG